MKQQVENQGEKLHQRIAATTEQKILFHKLVEACKRKDLATIERILDEHPRLLAYHDKFHRNLLHYTAILVLGSETSSQAEGADDVELRDGKSELDARARSLRCFDLLLARGEPKLWHQRDQDGLTVLHLAVISCNVPLVREILFQKDVPKRGGQERDLSVLVTTLDKEHHSPLHWAVITNNLECVKLLIDHSGVKLAHQADLNGATPLHYATQTSDYPKYRQQLRQMLKNATASSASLSTTSNAAQSSSSSGTTSASTSPMSSCDSTTLNNSSSNQQQQQQQQSEISYSLESKRGCTKLFRDDTLAQAADASAASASRSTEGTTGSCLTDSRAKDGNHHHYSGNLDILQFLAQLPGVNLEYRDRDLRTPLLWAASSGNRQAILLLLRSGANPLCQDANRLGPLHCSASHGFTDCLECFLSSSPSAKLTMQQMNQPDNLNCTPLFYAVLSGNIDCVELLLDRGARHDWQDVKGRTAAHFAALKGQLNTLKLLETHGANLWLANKQGDLPLHYAIKSGRQQVVAWLLEHSPYERAVNAINNSGRAPIHLAISKGNPTMVDFLIRQGANLNQLVKVRDKVHPFRATSTDAKKSPVRADSTSSTTITEAKVMGQHGIPTQASYHYETALDMARRLNQRECLELLEKNFAQSANRVLATRKQPVTAQARSGPGSKSLFDMQAAEVGSSPIGFETSGSSAEPPLSSEKSPTKQAVRLPKPPAGPEPLQSVPPQSDSTNSSALSQSSLDSIRGIPQPTAQASHSRAKNKAPVGPPRAGQQREEQQQPAQHQRSSASGRPYRGGINYHNERINASIKCKLYENQSFPPLSENLNRPKHDQYHSMGSLADRAQHSGAANGQQEIITNVNVYTTSPRCHLCSDHVDESQSDRCRECLRRQMQSGEAGVRERRRSSSNRAHVQESSETSDETSDATSEILFDESDRDEGKQSFNQPVDQNQGLVGYNQQGPPQQQQQQQPQGQSQVRYLPPSQAYTQHLPVILSAEEERSTSGETNNDQQQASSVSPEEVRDDKRHDPAQANNSPGFVEPHFERAAPRGRTQLRHVDRYRDHVKSPVAEYVHGGDARTVSVDRATDVRGWSQHHHHQPHVQAPNVRMDYSQVRAKVDSHRNDSGLSSHFGDDFDGTSSVGRRSKSWSTLSGQQAAGHQQVPNQQQHQTAMCGSPSVSPARNQQLASDFCGHPEHHHSRSCSRQTIIKTRRLSVDSVELASNVEKSIRKYKQENKLFEELQNLKRSQIRSGRANEALLVKRLVERFRHELQRDVFGLDVYHGPYTYQAYELYLYDQLRKLSQSNRAKLEGSRVPHKFTYPPAEANTTPADYEARDFLEEDLKAELELQRVLNRSGIQQNQQAHEPKIPVPNSVESIHRDTGELSIEPSGALEDIRVRRSSSHEAPEDTGKRYLPDAGTSDAAIGPSEELPRQTSTERRKSTPVVQEVDPDQRQEEIDEAHDGGSTPAQESRTAAGSSAASSRRSSVDVEREKLENLPLRVESKREQQSGELKLEDEDDSRQISSLVCEKERREIEAQAVDLTKAIITDALGNVSRAGSPVGPRKRETDEAESQILETRRESSDASEEQQITVEETEDVAVEDEPTEDKESSEQQQADEDTHAMARGRRRSVVNIGNKVEVIYHNVGIEIDTVGENQPSDDEEPLAYATKLDSQDGGDKSAAQETPTRAGGAEPQTKLEKVHEDDEEAGETEFQDQQLEGPVQELTGKDDGENTPEESEPLVEPGQVQTGMTKNSEAEAHQELEEERPSDSLSHTPTSSIVALGPEEFGRLKLKSDSTFSRRASSPPAPQRSSKVTRAGEATKTKHQTGNRRSSVDSYHPSTSDMIVVQRKVFNGFDLDSLHAHRKRHLAREASLTNEGPGGSQRQEPDSKPRVRSPKVSRIKKRLPRSQPPSGPYRVYVPTELIHERWFEVKRHERRRKKLLELEMAAQGDRNISDGNAHVVESESKNELPTRGQGMSHANSQPNLDSNRQRKTSLHEALSERETVAGPGLTRQDCSNFILIYELNKSARSAGGDRVAAEKLIAQGKQIEEEEQRRRRRHQVNWCHRRVIRIVDVRALKRTLSLPESLIYSNDLVKRFNILKL